MPNYLLGGLDPFIGARRRSRRGGGGGGGRTANFDAATARANRVASYVRPDVPGVPARDAAMIPAGFPAFAFVAGTGTSPVTQQMNVMTAFRGQRLTAVVIRNGASAALTAPMMQFFNVGMKPILASGTPVPLEVFTQNTFDTNMLLPPTIPGVLYTLSLALTSALVGTDSITCIVGVLGSAVL